LLRARIITALVLGAAVVVIVLCLPTSVVAIVLGVFWLVGAWEWAGFAQIKNLARILYLVPFLMVMIAALLWSVHLEFVNWILVGTLLWWLIVSVGVFLYPIPITMPVAALSGFLILLPAWLFFVYLHSTGGRGLALGVLIIVWAADVGGYIFGRTIGTLKLLPAVSPNKTWEGFVGGLVLAATAGWCLSLVLALPSAAFVTIAVGTAVVSLVGDLAVSIFKRNLGLKNSSDLLPGHGGVLDRVDSLSAAVPAFVFCLNLAGIGE